MKMVKLSEVLVSGIKVCAWIDFESVEAYLGGVNEVKLAGGTTLQLSDKSALYFEELLERGLA